MTRFLSNIVFEFIGSGCVLEGCAQKNTGFVVMAVQPSSSQGGQCSLWSGTQVLQMDVAWGGSTSELGTGKVRACNSLF